MCKRRKVEHHEDNHILIHIVTPDCNEHPKRVIRARSILKPETAVKNVVKESGLDIATFFQTKEITIPTANMNMQLTVNGIIISPTTSNDIRVPASRQSAATMPKSCAIYLLNAFSTSFLSITLFSFSPVFNQKNILCRNPYSVFLNLNADIHIVLFHFDKASFCSK